MSKPFKYQNIVQAQEQQRPPNERQGILRALLPVLMGAIALATGLIGLSSPARATMALPTVRAPHESPLAIGEDDNTSIRLSDVLTYYIYLPVIARAEICQPIPGESYGTLSVNPPPSDRPAAEHADLNLALRGYELTSAFKGLVDYGGGGDSNAPKLYGLFIDNRIPTFSNVYQVYDWNWGCNCRGSLLTEWEVTLAGMAVADGEIIRVPNSGYSIGSGYEVLVLYASNERITLKYTRDDNVVNGYTLHVENVCVEPSLLSLYQSSNAAGRGQLPALRPGQAFGRAKGSEIGVAIRDNGSFMDPRSQKDWW